MVLERKQTNIIFYCSVDSSLQQLDYIIFNPNIILAGCSKCKTQFKMNPTTFTFSEVTSTDNAKIKNCNTTATLKV